MSLEENDSRDLNNVTNEDDQSDLNMFSKNSESDISIEETSDMGTEESQDDNTSTDGDITAAKADVEDNNNNKGSNKRKLLLLLLFLLLGTIAFIVIPRLGTKSVADDNLENAAGIMNGMPEGMDADEILAQLQQKVDDSEFTISVNTRPVFANSSSKAKVDIVNSPGNTRPCKVEVTLADTGDIIYQNNDLLYPDQHIPYIRLSKNLDKGVYDSIVTYYVYDTDGKEQKGVMSAAMEIIIQN